MTRFSCEIQLWQLPGASWNFKFWNQSLLLTRMRILDDGFVMFSVNGIPHETSGISSFIQHLVSTYYGPNMWSARNREMKSSVFPKELLVWGRDKYLNKNYKTRWKYSKKNMHRASWVPWQVPSPSRRYKGTSMSTQGVRSGFLEQMASPENCK